MNINILLIIGKSGVGKTTLAEYMSKDMEHKYNIINSYTDRPKRDVMELGHDFVSKSKMDEILQYATVVAYTKYGNYRYCATLEQFEPSKINIYIVDNQGVIDVMAYDWEGLGFYADIKVLKLERDDVNVSNTRTDRDTPIDDFYIDCVMDNDETIPLLAEHVDCELYPEVIINGYN